MKAASRILRNHPLFSISTMVVLLLAIGFTPGSRPALADSARIKAAQYELSGPYQYENLAIFLVHGKDESDDRNLLTLEEALQKKIVTVHETGEVNELQVENTSRKFAVFLHSGDIVKGGKQDRALSNDFILPPKSGKIKVESFCVEQGRWEQREGEALSHFESSDQMLSSRELKVAARAKKDQSAVWDQVSKAQEKLSRNVGDDVRDSKSASSLQLALENKNLQTAVTKYLKKLSDTPNTHGDALGYAFYINGELNSVEIYSSNRLFRKLWPRLIRASATEAVGAREADGDASFTVAADPIKKIIEAPATADSKNTELSRRVRLKSSETDKNYLFETVDSEAGGSVKHRSYIMK